MPGHSDYPLQRALPPDVLVAGNALWSRYRHYPVFSRPWFVRRTRVFAVPVCGWGVVAVIGHALAGSGRAGLIGAAYMVVAFMLMAMAGPGLATWVRHRRWPLRRERVGVVAAVLLGMLGSYAIDSIGSTAIAHLLAGTAGYPDSADAIMAGFRPDATALAVLLPVLVYALFGGGMALRAYFSEQRRWQASRDARERADLQAQKRDADLRLGVLQAQVEPHFLFNTLASVRALVRQDPARAEATLDALVDHLRTTIPRLRDDGRLLHSTLGQQLDICCSYLDLVRLRIGERLTFDIDATPDLRARPYPPLLLITLVENAIKHGVEPKPGPVRVAVRAWIDADRLAVAVEDDGAGLHPGVGGGVGLNNVRAQLAMRHGERASLRLTGRPDRGVCAEIRIPLDDDAV